MFVTNGQVQTELILNGQSDGPLGSRLLETRFDPNLSRPFVDERGLLCVHVNRGRRNKEGKPVLDKMLAAEARVQGIPVVNATTSLRKDEWIQYDRAIKDVQLERLRAWADLAAVSSYGGFDGMSKTILEWETGSDAGEAFVDMDGLSEPRGDRPVNQLEGIPLPITHAGFMLSARELAASRNSGTPLDTRNLRWATRRVSERVEKTLIGTVTGMTYGNTSLYGRAPTVYGYTNFPARTTKTDLTVPDGTNATTTVNEVLAMIELAADDNFFGPFMLYHSTDWDKYLDDDYAVTGGNNPSQTLRQRLRAIEQISDVRRLDFLKASTNPFTLLLVEMTSEVAQAITAMPMRVVMWEEKGGMALHFRVMTIMVARLFADFDGRCGIVHGTTS